MVKQIARMMPPFLLLSLMLGGALLHGNIGLGMWVWPDEAYNTPEAREKLLTFSASKGISHLDQHIGFEHYVPEDELVEEDESSSEGATDGDPVLPYDWIMDDLIPAEMLEEEAAAYGEEVDQEGELQVRFKKEFAALVIEAHQKRITVNALVGSPKMFFRDRHERTLEELKAIIRFDQELPAGMKLKGVKYDVEPYGTPQWKAGGNSRQQVILDYLVFLRDAKQLLDKEASHLKLSVDVPFWWDDEKFKVKFEGKRKLLSEHIQDRVDYMSIMSYRPTTKEVLEIIENELAYAARINKPIYAGLETMRLKGKEQWISFADRPPEEFRQVVGELKAKLSRRRGAGLIMLHHYNSLVPYLERLSK